MTRRSVSVWAFMCFAVLCFGGCGAIPAVEVPSKGFNASCDNIRHSGICDSDLHARFPELLPSDRVLDSDSFDSDWPVTVVINYTPEVVDAHTVRAKRMVCIQYREGIPFDCRLYRPTGYYEAHPDDYLVATDNVQPSIGQLIVHLWMTGRVAEKGKDATGEPASQDIRWYTLDHSLFKGYTFSMSSSGCGGTIHIRIDGEGERQVLRLTDPSDAIMCH